MKYVIDFMELKKRLIENGRKYGSYELREGMQAFVPRFQLVMPTIEKYGRRVYISRGLLNKPLCFMQF